MEIIREKLKSMHYSKQEANALTGGQKNGAADEKAVVVAEQNREFL